MALQALLDHTIVLSDDSRQLRIEYHKYDETRVVILLRELCTNTTVVHLHFSYDTLSSCVLGELCGLLQANKTLQTLWLQDALTSSAHTERLLCALFENRGLVELDIALEPRITHNVLRALAQVIKHNTTLRIVRLHCTRYALPSLRRLERAITYNHTLEQLNIYTKFDVDALQISRIRSLFPPDSRRKKYTFRHFVLCLQRWFHMNVGAVFIPVELRDHIYSFM